MHGRPLHHVRNLPPAHAAVASLNEEVAWRHGRPRHREHVERVVPGEVEGDVSHADAEGDGGGGGVEAVGQGQAEEAITAAWKGLKGVRGIEKSVNHAEYKKKQGIILE